MTNCWRDDVDDAEQWPCGECDMCQDEAERRHALRESPDAGIEREQQAEIQRCLK